MLAMFGTRPSLWVGLLAGSAREQRVALVDHLRARRAGRDPDGAEGRRVAGLRRDRGVEVLDRADLGRVAGAAAGDVTAEDAELDRRLDLALEEIRRVDLAAERKLRP